jgi:hypothetical protein
MCLRLQLDLTWRLIYKKLGCVFSLVISSLSLCLIEGLLVFEILSTDDIYQNCFFLFLTLLFPKRWISQKYRITQSKLTLSYFILVNDCTYSIKNISLWMTWRNKEQGINNNKPIGSCYLKYAGTRGRFYYFSVDRLLISILINYFV